MDKILYKEESYLIIGKCIEVHNNLGAGFLEIVYKDALEFEFRKADIPYEREKLYEKLNLTQISYKLNYSSVAHLSNQFKKVTGLTPTFFKHLKQNRRRIALEDV